MNVHSSQLLPKVHPASHGGINLNLQIDAGVIKSASLEIGLMHRGAEKLMEFRDYRQGAALANRHVWSSPTAGEYAYVLAAEELLGMQITPRADAHRAVFCEIDRVISHLTFLSYLAPMPVREKWANFMERTTGARMHHQVIRIGGVAFSLDAEHLDEAAALSEETRMELRAIELPGDGIGVLTSSVASSHGVSGPIARASGVAFDERQRGYGWYQNFQVIVQSSGDAKSRFEQLQAEIAQSLELIELAGRDCSGNDELLQRTPKTIRLPEGEAFASVEGALGSNGVALFSTGGKAPDRLRLRTASLGNLSALEEVLVGTAESDLALCLASWPFLAGDSDR